MHRRKLILPAPSAFILLLLAACTATAPQAPVQPPTPTTSPQRPDDLPRLQARPLNEIVKNIPYSVPCRDFATWFVYFGRQYPGVDPGVIPDDYQSMPLVGNMFRESVFAPRFGTTYTLENGAKVMDLLRRTRECREEHKDEQDPMQPFFIVTEPFFNRVFSRVDPVLERIAIDYNMRERWMRRTIDSLPTLPDNTDGLAQLDADISFSQTHLSLLSAMEQAEFAAAAAARRREIASKLGIPNTMPSSPAAQTGTLEERVAARVGELKKIPLTVEGRQRSAEWMLAFDRDFLAYDGNDAVMKARMKWILNREEIYKATRSDFRARLAKLPKGEGSEQANAKLLTDTFPLPTDPTMPIYQEYREDILARQNPLFKRTFDKAVGGLRSMGSWISDAARKIVHGSPSSDPK